MISNRLTKLTAGLVATFALTSHSLAANEGYGDDRRWFLSFMAGGASAPDNDFDSGPEVMLGVGKPFANHFAWEVLGSFLDLEANSGGNYERTALSAGVLMYLNPAFTADAEQWQPFLGVYATAHDIDYAGQNSSNFGADISLGFNYKLGSVDIRAELRHQVDEFKINVAGFNDETYQHTAGLVGVRWPLGAKPKPYNADEDADGVPDRIDNCLNTPAGVAVGPNGCPLDSDQDGVPDVNDRCPDTPLGTKVNADGCPLDKDNDGVPDAYDQCPNTAPGALVNSQGCALDSDNDGVPNGLDACPNTAPGVLVDNKGCSLDEDGDGVPNKIDACPGTIAGARVNSQGCVISQNVELRGIHFEFNKARLMVDSRSVLKTVAESLINEPSVGVVVEGHTDSVGSDNYNQQLSQKRANAVADFLVSNGVRANRIKAIGYGESRPAASNDTEEGRERNRRVELKLSSN